MNGWIDDWAAYAEARAALTAAVELALSSEMSEQEVRDTVESAFAAREPAGLGTTPEG